MENKYNYKGALQPVNVKIIHFYNAPDFILSVEQWEQEGGWKGLIKSGAFSLRNVEKVIAGTMSPIEFNALEAWEG